MSIILDGTNGIVTPDIDSGVSTLGPLTQALNLGSTGQVVFPATQNASSNANTLDDYEEGTWTPNQGAGLTVVGTFSSSGTYTKIGRLVTVVFRVNATTSVAAAMGDLITTNLPFSAAGLSTGGATNASPNSSAVILGTSTSVIPAADISASATIFASITYIV